MQEGSTAAIGRVRAGQDLPPLPPATAGMIDLRILATSDVHGWILPWDYHAGRPVPDAGLARVGHLVDRARAAGNCVLFDNGDFLQGTPLIDGGPVAGVDHPAIRAMNDLGYDAATLGNHEFNFGIDALHTALDQARFPAVCANVTDMAGQPIVPHWTVLTRQVRDGAGGVHDLRIGVTGAVPVQILTWDRAHLEGRVQVRPMIDAVRDAVDVLRPQCDVVVVLCHAGIGPADAPPDSEDAATAVAGIPGVDAIVAGHTHRVFPMPTVDLAGVDGVAGTLQGVPAVMPGSRGSHLGVIDLRLRAADRAVVHARATAVDVRNTPPSHAPAPALLRAHEAVLRDMDRPLGQSDRPLNSFFAMVAPIAITAMVAEASACHIRQKVRGDLPVLGTGQPFKCGGRGGPSYYTDIPAGPLTLRHVSDICTYPNTVAALRLTGEEVRLWLERAAGVFRQICPGKRDQRLLDPDVPSYTFDIIHGVDFQIDLSAPAMFDRAGRRVSDGRIRNLTRNGAPIGPEEVFVIATSSYRAGGTGGFAPRPPFLTDTRRLRDVLADHLAMPSPRPFWGFVPMPGTSVVFPTSPRARVEQVPHLTLEPMGIDANGFQQVRLSL